MSDEDRIYKPPPEGQGELAREVDERPIVRDSKDNPVVRTLDLELALKPLYKLLYVAIGAGVINLLPTVASLAARSTPSSPTTSVVGLIFQIL